MRVRDIHMDVTDHFHLSALGLLQRPILMHLFRVYINGFVTLGIIRTGAVVKHSFNSSKVT